MSRLATIAPVRAAITWQLTGVSTGAITSDVATIRRLTETTSYDALGRPSISEQLFGASRQSSSTSSYPFTGVFRLHLHLAGALATETYLQAGWDHGPTMRSIDSLASARG